MPPDNAYFTPDALDRWATDTNGSPLPPEAKEELSYLDGTEDGNLTCAASPFIYSNEADWENPDSRASCKYTNSRRRMMRKKLGGIWCAEVHSLILKHRIDFLLTAAVHTWI